MPAAARGGILRRMKLDPTTGNRVAAEPDPTPPEAPETDIAAEENPAPPAFDPNIPGDRSLSERMTYTLPKPALGWARDEADLKFTVAQLTLSDRCRAFRTSVNKLTNMVSTGDLGIALVKESIVRIGANDNPGTDDVESWWSLLGPREIKLIGMAYDKLHTPTAKQANAYTKSRRLDPQRRRHVYTLPTDIVPPKRWPARSFIVDAKADLTFAMQEMTVADEQAASNAVEDIDDNASHRAIQLMFSIRSIGGHEVGNTPEELALKRAWLDDIGPQAYKLVTGTYAQLHEVDLGLIEQFLNSAEPPDSAA